MGNKKRRIVPIVPIGRAPSISAKPVTSLKLARKLTSKFHALLNEEAILKSGSSSTSSNIAQKAARLKEIKEEMERMGGRDAYQEASALSTKVFRSSRYVFKKLVGFGLQPKRGEPPLKVLEIGAVNAQLVVCPWLKVRAIDITSRDPKHIEQKDFFDIPVLDAAKGEYDVIVNAMVINCVPEIARRGEMICRCHDHLKPGGLMFFAIPSRCIDMSEFFTRARFEALVEAAGFTIREDHRTPKISFYILQRTDHINMASLSTTAGHTVSAWTSSTSAPAKGSPPVQLFSIPSVFIAGTDRVALFNARSSSTAAKISEDAGSDDEHSESSDASGEDDDEHEPSYASAAPGSKRKRAPPSGDKPAGVQQIVNASVLTDLRTQLHKAAAKFSIAHAAKAWKPVMFPPVASLPVLRKLSPPHSTLPKSELPITGFTRTDFVITIDPSWLHVSAEAKEHVKPASGSTKGRKS